MIKKEIKQAFIKKGKDKTIKTSQFLKPSDKTDKVCNLKITTWEGF